jgi:gluconolactonase
MRNARNSRVGGNPLAHWRVDGTVRTLADSVDGKPMGKVNFVIRDSGGRIWITVSTAVNPWSDALRSTLADGAGLRLARRYHPGRPVCG